MKLASLALCPRWPVALLAAALGAGCGGAQQPMAPAALAARTAPAPGRPGPQPGDKAPASSSTDAAAAAPATVTAGTNRPRTNVAPIPAAYRPGPVPHLVVAGADHAIKWYERVFGAVEIYQARGPKGRIMHAILRVGDRVFTLSDAYPELGSKGPKALGGSPASIRLSVRDADALFKRAIADGATAAAPMAYELSGNRVGRFVDPFGHHWAVATRVVAVPPTVLGALAGEAAGTQASAPPAGAAKTSKPEIRPTLAPDLIVTDIDKAVAFYKAAFGAVERSRVAGPDGAALHAAIVIRHQVILLDRPAAGQKPPTALAGGAASLTLYVADAGAVFKKAVAAGATARLPVMNMFWGDRWGELVDPFGQVWSIATHEENVSVAEIEKRAAAAFAKVHIKAEAGGNAKAKAAKAQPGGNAKAGGDAQAGGNAK